MDLSRIEKIEIPFEQLLPDECYLVGGTIRDALLGFDPIDFDIVVPKDAIGLALRIRREIEDSRLVILSKEDDEVRLVFSTGEWLDITSFRAETIEEDLKLRDFTINSLAVPIRDRSKLLDPTGGLIDLQKRLLRAYSPRNLESDPLRILRAFRFVSTIEFDIEDETFKWIKERADSITKAAPERIRYELFRLFNGEAVSKAVRLMAQSGVLFALFPPLKEQLDLKQRYIVEQNVFEHTMLVIEFLEKLIKEVIELRGVMGKYHHRLFPYLADRRFRFAFYLGALLHDVAKPRTIFYDEEGRTHFHGHDKLGAQIAAELAERLRLSNYEKDIVTLMVAAHMHPHLLAREKDVTMRALNRYLRRTGDLAFPLILFTVADALATPPIGKGAEGQLRLAEKLEKLLREKEKKPKKRLVTGHDIIKLGLQPGPIFKKILQEIEDLEAEGKIKTREDALKELQRIVKLVKEGRFK